MAKRKLSPLVQAMTIYSGLDERDKATLFDWIKSQTVTPRKAANKKPRAEKEAPRFVPICVVCGNEESHQDHQKDADSYHIFRTSLAKKRGGKTEEVVLPDNPEAFVHGATA